MRAMSILRGLVPSRGAVVVVGLSFLIVSLSSPLWCGSAQAAVKVEFADRLNNALRSAGQDAASERQRIESGFNNGLEELGKKNPAAKALFESNQTIRIVCYGDPEAKGLKPATGIQTALAEPAETLGDFDAAGNPKKNGKAIIVIDCTTVAGRKGFFAVPEGASVQPLYGVLVHELLHATNKKRKHAGPGTDDLGLYRQWEKDFATAQAKRDAEVQRAERKKRREERRKRKAEAEKKKAEQHSSVPQTGEQSSFDPTLPANNFYAFGQIGHADGPNIPFLALEFGPGTLHLGAVIFEPQGTQTGFQAGGRVKIADNASPLPRDRVFFNYNFFHNGFDDHQSLGNLFTDGAGLGIPGTGDPLANFPAGVFLPYAGGLNTVDNLFGSYDFNTIGGGLAVGTVFDVGNGITVAPFAGVDFASINQDTRFGGQIPGYNLDFVYNTTVDAFQVSPNIGAEVIVPIIGTDGGPGPNVALQVIPRIYVDTVFFDGTDRLDLSGIVNDGQRVNLDGSDTNLGIAIDANVVVQILNGMGQVSAGVRFEERSLATVIQRTGEVGEQSRAVSDFISPRSFRFSVGFRF